MKASTRNCRRISQATHNQTHHPFLNSGFTQPTPILSLSLSLMGRRTTKLRDHLIGVMKDKASQSRAAIHLDSLHLALLRATTHDPFTPPPPKHLSHLLSSGNSSRATASAAIHALMDRLQTTHDSAVALKSLLAVHHVIKHGSFILQDQLSVYPAAGGRNYLKLSNFRDNSTPVTWHLSSWVRWYGQYLETLLLTSRVLGFFLGSASCIADRDREEERVSAVMNSDLVKEIESLVSLLGEISKLPELMNVSGNRLVGEVMRLVGEDQISAMNAVSVRVGEFNERLGCLSFGDSVELLSALNRSEDCKERLLTVMKTEFAESFWGSIRETKGKVGKEIKEDKNKLVMTVRRDGGSESARFGDRVMRSSDSVRFSSGRILNINTFNLPLDSCPR